MAQGRQQLFFTPQQTRTFLWQDAFKTREKNGKKGRGRLLIEVTALQAWKRGSNGWKAAIFNRTEQIFLMNISHSSVISLGEIPALLRLDQNHMIRAAFLQCLMELLAPWRADSFIIIIIIFYHLLEMSFIAAARFVTISRRPRVITQILVNHTSFRELLEISYNLYLHRCWLNRMLQ